MKIRKPIMGEPIYVPTSLYVYRGKDDFEGGICAVNRIEMGKSAGKPTFFIGIKERPGVLYNWEYLVSNQEELKRKYAGRRGRRTPDLRPEFNTDDGWVSHTPRQKVSKK